MNKPNNSSIETLLDKYSKISLLRFSTAGSVDDGKSTLIGRLLFDTKSLHEDTVDSVKSATKNTNVGEIDMSLFTDGLKSEREQGITIDVAYRYFATEKRKFILADTPGHEQYTRNMATGASNSNVAVILIDARKGVLTQTKRHSFICSLLGIKHFAVAVNKMDLVDFSEEVFENIKTDYQNFAKKLEGMSDVRFFPLSAITGDNVCTKSERMKWYEGETLLNYLENVYVAGDRNLVDFRLPVQYVIKRPNEKRHYTGKIASGSVKKGDKIVILPSGKTADIHEVYVNGNSVQNAAAPLSVAVSLSEELDIGRGDLIAPQQNRPELRTNIEAMLVWMAEAPLDTQKNYLVQHATSNTQAKFSSVNYLVDVNTLSRTEADEVRLNDVARVNLQLGKPLASENYAKNRQTGSFILIDKETMNTVAAGMIINRLPERDLKDHTENTRNIVQESGYVSESEQSLAKNHRGLTVWFSGLSGSGKSSIAKVLQRKLHESEHHTFALDGDNLRHGLCSDLGFSPEDRAENLRRASEVAKLFNQSGSIVLAAFITPTENDRQRIRQNIGSDNLVEVFVDTPIEICEERDSKGLYKKARSGEIPFFTGVSAPFEPPTQADISIDSSQSIEEAAEKVYQLIMTKL